MKTAILLLFAVSISYPSFCQSCCGNHIMDQFSVGTFSETTYAQGLQKFDQSLVDGKARIWVGQENTCVKKPLLVLIHGGGFTGGTPGLMDSLAVSFARKGYLSASISYRLGWLGEGYCSFDTTEAIRAWFRAVQDCHQALDYFKANYEAFGIDTNLIFLAGWSAGGYVALGASMLDLDEEKPTQCFEQAPIILNSNEFLRPDLGIVHSDAPEIKAIATFSSSMLFPQLMNQGTNAALIAFNNTQDPYLIPITQCSSWWQIDDCASSYPVSCGIENLTEQFANLGVELQSQIFSSNTCPHNLHEPCFPFWQQEVESMSEFFNQKMECEIPLSSQEQSEKRLLILENGFNTSFFQWPKAFIIYNNQGSLINQSNPDFSDLPLGFYFIKNLETGLTQRVLIK